MTDDNVTNVSGSGPKAADNMFMRADLDLWRLVYCHPDAMFVTDGQGFVLLVNPASEQLLDFQFDRNSRPHVSELVKNGVYSRSTVLEAIEKRTTITGMITNHAGVQLMTTSHPVFNKHGEIELVITCSRSKTVVESFLAESLAAEQARLDRYRSAVSYLGKVSLTTQPIIHESPSMRAAITLATSIARLDSTVLLTGESGTGKELVANYIHQNSPRSQEPFIPINCAAIPAELLESELFGYARGAFSGANAQGKPGLFEIADGGTLFLDEIGDMPLSLQPKLLRALETGEIQRLGSTERKHVNVRTISATNKNLWEMVESKQFRADLYFRLNVIPIYLPPLRDRPEDLCALADSILEDCNRKYGQQRRFTSCGKKYLREYPWPGNIRELRNVVERLSLVGPDAYIDGTACRNALQDVKPSPPDKLGEVLPLRQFRAMNERAYILKVLDHFQTNVSRAATALGMHRVALYRKLRELGITVENSSEM